MMDTPERILVIFLSLALALFLVLGITVLIKVIQIVNQAKHIGEKAERITDKAETAVNLMGRVAPTVAFSKIISLLTSAFLNNKDNKEKSNEKKK